MDLYLILIRCNSSTNDSDGIQTSFYFLQRCGYCSVLLVITIFYDRGFRYIFIRKRLSDHVARL